MIAFKPTPPHSQIADNQRLASNFIYSDHPPGMFLRPHIGSKNMLFYVSIMPI